MNNIIIKIILNYSYLECALCMVTELFLDPEHKMLLAFVSQLLSLCSIHWANPTKLDDFAANSAVDGMMWNIQGEIIFCIGHRPSFAGIYSYSSPLAFVKSVGYHEAHFF